MALTVERQLRIWGVAALVFLLVLWLLGDVILPFVIGGVLAYLLDPIVDRIERAGLRRVWAVVVITLGAVVLFVLASLLVIPTLVQQANLLVQTVPALSERFSAALIARFPELLDEGSALRQQLIELGGQLQAAGTALLGAILTSAAGVINVIIITLIVPVVAFYLLLDWDRMVARLDDLLPREHAPTIRALAREADQTLASFIRGQGLVCLILGTYYALALMAVGLNFGLVIGAVAGLLTFIPYVGALVGGILAIGLALFQFWGDWIWVLVVWAIFQSGQFVEGNFLTPKLVGESVGVHPVWLLFALAAFGALFGFVGILVAVPVAAILGVLIRFFVRKYKLSRLYTGPSDAAPEDPPAAPGEDR
jgi:predicted PurR-regulated permease PerM